MEFSKECAAIKIGLGKHPHCGDTLIIKMQMVGAEEYDDISIPLSQLQQLIDMLNELNNEMNNEHKNEHAVFIPKKELTAHVPETSASAMEVGNRLAMLSQGVDPETAKEVAKNMREKEDSIMRKLQPSKRRTRDSLLGLLRGFDRFWDIYPRRVGMGLAKASWAKLDPSEGMLEAIIKAVEYQKKSDQWKRDSGQYIPYPSTWLNQERWLDEPDIKNEPRRKPTWKEVAEARHQKAVYKATVSDSPISPTGPILGPTIDKLTKVIKTTIKESEDSSSNGKNTDDKTAA